MKCIFASGNKFFPLRKPGLCTWKSEFHLTDSELGLRKKFDFSSEKKNLKLRGLPGKSMFFHESRVLAPKSLFFTSENEIFPS